MSFRSPIRDSRFAEKKDDPNQVSPILSYNLPVTKLLEKIKEGYTTISILFTKKDDGSGEWITKFEDLSRNSKRQCKINFNKKTFELIVDHDCIKLSGPGLDSSLNLMMRYILETLNRKSTKEQVEQRFKTINKKINKLLKSEGFDSTNTPLDFLVQVYEKCINGIPVFGSEIIPVHNNQKHQQQQQQPKKKSSPQKKSVSLPKKSPPPSLKKKKEDSKLIFLDNPHDDTVFNASIPTSYFLAPSKYLNKEENGLFTKQKIKNESPIFEYKGISYPKAYSAKSYDDLYKTYFHPRNVSGVNYILRNKSYEIEINNNIIDASIQSKSSFVRYVNSGFPDYFRNNCEFIQSGNKVILVATRDIEEGEELLCSYGINSESNVTNSNFKITIEIRKIPDISKEEDTTNYGNVEYTEYIFGTSSEKKSTEKSMKLDDFAKKYYETLISYLQATNKLKLYTKHYLTKLRQRRLDEIKSQIGKYKYDRSEFDKFKNTEHEAFMNKIKHKIDELKNKKLHGYKQDHFEQLKKYYQKISEKPAAADD
jgi:hypothetical protein